MARVDELSQLCAARRAARRRRARRRDDAPTAGYADVGDRTPDDAGRDEGERLVAVAEELRRQGHEIREVAAGGSISGRGVAAAPGVTELRAGTYVFNDLMQLAAGVCGVRTISR